MDIREKKWEVLYDTDTLKQITKKLGEEINCDYKDSNLLILSILKGSLFFTADLTRNITVLPKIDFIITSSYGNEKTHTGKVQLIKDIEYDLTAYDVLLVDDILDTGITMDFLLQHLKKKNPKSIKTCVLFNKQERRTVNLQADYVGYEIEDKFLVGYGLDYEDRYRNIPYVFCVLDENR